MKLHHISFIIGLISAICLSFLVSDSIHVSAITIQRNRMENSLRQDIANSASVDDTMESLQASASYATSKPTSSPIPWDSAATSAINSTVADWDNLPQWAQIVMSIAIILLGLINVYYGYRFLPFSFFMIGGFVVFIIMLGIMSAAISDTNPNKTAIVYGVSVACWVVAGLIFVALSQIAVFLLGAAVGVVIAIILNPICLHYVWPANPQGNLYIWMTVFGLVTGIITCYFERPILIVSTVLTGSLFVILGIGGMAGNLPVITAIVDDPNGTKWEWWAYIGGWAALVVTGLIVQICYTAKDKEYNTKNGYARLE